MVYSFKFVASQNDAFDIVQSVFAQVWEKKKYALEDKHLKSYLFNATRNACLNHLKHLDVVKKFENDASTQLRRVELSYSKNGEQSLIEKEGLERIHKAINALSEKNKEIIVLSRLEGLKNDEIAQKLGVPVRTVETRLFRALKSLRKRLTNDDMQALFLFFLKKVKVN